MDLEAIFRQADKAKREAELEVLREAATAINDELSEKLTGTIGYLAENNPSRLQPFVNDIDRILEKYTSPSSVRSVREAADSALGRLRNAILENYTAGQKVGLRELGRALGVNNQRIGNYFKNELRMIVKKEGYFWYRSPDIPSEEIGDYIVTSLREYGAVSVETLNALGFGDPSQAVSIGRKLSSRLKKGIDVEGRHVTVEDMGKSRSGVIGRNTSYTRYELKKKIN